MSLNLGASFDIQPVSFEMFDHIEPQLFSFIRKIWFCHNEMVNNLLFNCKTNQLLSTKKTATKNDRIMHAKVRRPKWKKNVCRNSFEKYHFELLPFEMQLSEAPRKKKQMTRKWRIKGLEFNEKNMQRMNGSILLSRIQNASIGKRSCKSQKKIQKKLQHREKVCEFKFKRLTTLNYNALEKKRPIQWKFWTAAATQQQQKHHQQKKMAKHGWIEPFILCMYLYLYLYMYIFWYVSTFSQLIEVHSIEKASTHKQYRSLDR